MNDEKVGILSKKSTGLFFSYDPHAKQAISLSLPREGQTSPFFQNKVQFFIDNLIPEGDAFALVFKLFKPVSRNAFDILYCIGQEVAGALLFCEEDAIAPQNNVYRDVTNEVEAFLRTKDPRSIEEVVRARFSLAGAQHKVAIYFADDRIFVPEDYSPTTHILKPDSREFPGTARNEHLCLDVAKRLGFPVCQHELLIRQGYDALLLGRYDRVRTNNTVRRLHQEDFCQAMGLPPIFKYQSTHIGRYGEYGLVALLETAQAAHIDIADALAKRCAFSFFVGNFDAHAKNYSLLYTDHGIELAPLYDILCIPALGSFERELSMDIGGSFNPDTISSNNFLMQGYDMEVYDIEAYANTLADILPDIVFDVAKEHAKIYGSHQIYDKIVHECTQIAMQYKKLSQQNAREL
ncbi:MAG: HipA domain-containing protein [Desulfovibrio sp.]|nr:HipA domain-containing protein [Desulfovibrio sp.]